MTKLSLVILWYRFKCLKLAIDTAFYCMITFNILAGCIYSLQAFLWIFLITIFSPLEILVLAIVDLMDKFSPNNDITIKIKEILKENNRNIEWTKKAYELYRKRIDEGFKD